MKETGDITVQPRHDTDYIIGQALRYGVLSAGLIVIIGAVYYLYQNGLAEVPLYSHFRDMGAEAVTFGTIGKGLLHGRSEAIIQAGVCMLIAIPVVRVLFSLLSFIIERDRTYIIITVLVLAIILLSMLSGIKG